MCATACYVHSQDYADPVIINAVSDAVKRHPNLVEVTVGWGCGGSPALGAVKGVLQKEDVRKVDVIKIWDPIILDPLLESTDVMNSEYKCNSCVVSAVCSRVHCVPTLFSYQGGLGPRVPHTCNEEGVTEGSGC